MRYFIIALLFLVSCALGQQSVFHEGENITMSITTAGDTAKVYTITPLTVLDSFRYYDSMVYTAALNKWDTAGFTSPNEVVRIWFGMDTTHTYNVDFAFSGGDTLEIAYDCRENDTLAYLVDTIVARINALADLTDSVTAHDSASYVKIVSNFGGETFLERWYVVPDDSLTITYDTTTLEMICDSMVAALNAMDSAKYWTAAVQGDTVYTVTSDDPGLDFKTVPADTIQDTALTQVNVTSWSQYSDTINLGSVTSNFPYCGIYGTFVIDSTTTLTSQGLGLLDSCIMRFGSARRIGTNIEYFWLDSSKSEGLPCSLSIAHPAKDGCDTLLKESLYLNILVKDTASDTTATIYYPFYKDYMLFEK